MKVTTLNGPVIPLVEKSDVTLLPDTLVTLHTDGTAKAAIAGSVIGAMVERLGTTTNKTLAIRLCNNGGTMRVIQSAAIAIGAAVSQDPAAPTKVHTLVAGEIYLGIKKGPNAGAASDVIEIFDNAKNAAADLGLATVTGILHGNVDSAVSGLTIGGTYSQAEVQALRAAVETLADDHRSLRAGVIAAGVPLVLA